MGDLVVVVVVAGQGPKTTRKIQILQDEASWHKVTVEIGSNEQMAAKTALEQLIQLSLKSLEKSSKDRRLVLNLTNTTTSQCRSVGIWPKKSPLSMYSQRPSSKSLCST